MNSPAIQTIPAFELEDSLCHLVDFEPARSCWGRGVQLYALELAQSIHDEGSVIKLRSFEEFETVLLGGADNWLHYSETGCSLFWDEDIAARLMTPSEYSRVSRAGFIRPNSRESWLEMQARALRAAARLAWRTALDCLDSAVFYRCHSFELWEVGELFSRTDTRLVAEDALGFVHAMDADSSEERDSGERYDEHGRLLSAWTVRDGFEYSVHLTAEAVRIPVTATSSKTWAHGTGYALLHAVDVWEYERSGEAVYLFSCDSGKEFAPPYFIIWNGKELRRALPDEIKALTDGQEVQAC